MSRDVVEGPFKVVALQERIDELITRSGPSQKVRHKLIARSEAGEKISVLSGEPFAGVVIGDELSIHIVVRRSPDTSAEA